MTDRRSPQPDPPDGPEGLEPGDAAARDALRAAPVPRLDEQTRRRLVRHAIDAVDATPERRGRTRWLAAAAAVVALGLMAAAVVWATGDGTSTQVASDHSEEELAADDAGEGDRRDEGSSAAADQGAPLDSSLRASVDLGELRTDEELDAAVTSLAARAALAAGPSTEAAEAPLPCAGTFEPGPDGAIEAGATASFRGRPIVILVEQRDDDVLATILDAASCAALPGWEGREL